MIKKVEGSPDEKADMVGLSCSGNEGKSGGVE
jgi:hypothetical protein